MKKRSLLGLLLLPAALAGCVSAGPAPRTAIGPMSGERPLPGVRAPIAMPSVPPPPAVPAAPIAIHLDDAVLMALENNRQLSVQRLQPRITGTFGPQEAAAFDPVFDGSISFSRQRSTRRGATNEERLLTQGTEAVASLNEFFPTGTLLSFDLSENDQDQRPGPSSPAQTRGGMSVTQSLLRGFGLGPNLASLRQARLDTLISEYELRGFAETLAADVESAYWDCALAQRQIVIYSDSLQLAERQLKQTEDRITVGTLAPTERAAAQAEVALRREALIDARSALAASRLRLLRLLNPPGGLTAEEVTLQDEPTPPVELEMEDPNPHVALAMRMRPELNEARLRIQHGDLELVKTRNGLLPQLDLFAALGRSGYARSFSDASDRTTQGNNYDATVGLSLEIPVGNRAARAAHQRATLDREQNARALENLAQLVELDVRLAWIEVLRAREQVTATAATLRYQEEVLRAEQAKFEADKSTSFLVAQAQNALVAARVQEVVAVVACLKSLSDLYRLEGSLLERRRIAAPGNQPPESQRE